MNIIKKTLEIGLVFGFFGNPWAMAEQKIVKGMPNLSKLQATKESVVDIQGKKFRRIQLEKESFYVEALDSTNANSELRVLCQQGREEIMPAQVEVAVKATQRSGIVIEGMRQACKAAAGGRKEITLDPSVLVGLQIDLGNNQNRKIIVTPVGVTFKADW